MKQHERRTTHTASLRANLGGELLDNAAVMYTRCPECQTIFHITAAQLGARAGLVRCGKCKAVFRADRHLLETLPALGTPEAARTTKKKKKPPRPMALADQNTEIPTITELGGERVRTRAVFWALGNVSLIALLLFQVAYFYRNELALHYPALRPALLAFCEYFGCRLETPYDVGLIELLAQTRVEPHPSHENALRVSISMVNRAAYAQPYPLMELSLSDRAGNLLARRIFTPLEYLGRRPAEDERLAPNVVKNIVLDVTNPHGKAVGYEIRPVAAAP